jgi:uncharacterized protein
MIEHRHCNAQAVDDPPLRWIWSQHWLDVLFLHWRVLLAELRPHIPAPLEVQTFGGEAWVSLVCFRLRVRPRGLPFLPGFSNLLEANLRTYVEFRDRPGIWFLDVLADNPLAIQIARRLTPMPYRRAEVSYFRGTDQMRFAINLTADTSHCSDGKGRQECLSQVSVGFRAGREQQTIGDTLDSWLLERYRLYLRGRRGLVQADAVHPPWRVLEAEITDFSCSIGERLSLDLAHRPDRIHFSPGVKARFGAFVPIPALPYSA